MEFRHHLEHMVCDGPDHTPGCGCTTLKRLYGPRLYHCKKAFCSAYTSGFEARTSLIDHLQIHSLNHRCHFPNCVFAEMGFQSSDELTRHIKNAHEPRNMPNFSTDPINLAILPEADQLELLYDAMANGQLDAVRNLARESVLTKAPKKIIETAAWHSPPDIVSWLLNRENYGHSPLRESCTYTEIALHAAIEGENLPNIKLLLGRGADIMSSCRLQDAANDRFDFGEPPTGVLRALRRWNGTLMKFLVEDCGATIPRTWDEENGDPSAIFCAKHLSDSTLEDTRRRFGTMKPYILWPEAYTLAPYYAVLAHSPALVRVSLENGGDPNKRTNISPRDRSPLGEFVVYGSEKQLEIAALLLEYKADPNVGNDRGKPIYDAVQRGRSELVKLLLQHGANPNVTSPKQLKKIEHLVGMRRVEDYFGIPWHDIVRRIQAGESVERKGK